MKKYSLMRADYKPESRINYTKKALIETGHADLVPTMWHEAYCGGYQHLEDVCEEYLELCNATQGI